MSDSVLVFVSHSSEDKESYVEPIVSDLENCFINVWIDKRKILPGKNLRKSILRDGLDKADVALLFFTQNSLNSAWVDREIKHLLRDELDRRNYDLNKIISIFDSENTYHQIEDRYPELTDDLLHLMPVDYEKIHLGKLVSAIWSKHFSLQGGDVETKRQLLAKDQEIFQKDKELFDLKRKLEIKPKSEKDIESDDFHTICERLDLDYFLQNKTGLLRGGYLEAAHEGVSDLMAIGLVDFEPNEDPGFVYLTKFGHDFLKWYTLNKTITKLPF